MSLTIMFQVGRRESGDMTKIGHGCYVGFHLPDVPESHQSTMTSTSSTGNRRVVDTFQHDLSYMLFSGVLIFIFHFCFELDDVIILPLISLVSLTIKGSSSKNGASNKVVRVKDYFENWICYEKSNKYGFDMKSKRESNRAEKLHVSFNNKSE